VQAEVREKRGLSWTAVVGWVCLIVFVGSLWNGSDSGPLFWAGAIAIDILVVGSVYLLIRWLTRQVESRAG
jgi:hypothetical protein